jgi:hypothetical protein
MLLKFPHVYCCLGKLSLRIIRLIIILQTNPKIYKLASLKQYKFLHGFACKIIKVLLMLAQMFSTTSIYMLKSTALSYRALSYL